jgi:hypothetical protein
MSGANVPAPPPNLDLRLGRADDIAAVWKSTDGGQNWTTSNLPPRGAPPASTGHQGSYNQALAVSQDQQANCSTFALGWS